MNLGMFKALLALCGYPQKYSGSAAPSGEAGGDLSGSYPDPAVAQASGADFTVKGFNSIVLTPSATGGTPSIAAAGGNTNVSLKLSAAGSAGINLASPTAVTGALSTTGAISPGGVTTVGSTGVSAVVAEFGRTAQAVDLPQSTLYTVETAGLHRISLYAEVTQAATTSSTLPSVEIAWTGADSQTAVSFPTATPTNSANAKGALGNGSVVVSCEAGSTITISTTGYASSGATPMQFAVRAAVEFLG